LDIYIKCFLPHFDAKCLGLGFYCTAKMSGCCSNVSVSDLWCRILRESLSIGFWSYTVETYGHRFSNYVMNAFAKVQSQVWSTTYKGYIPHMWIFFLNIRVKKFNQEWELEVTKPMTQQQTFGPIITKGSWWIYIWEETLLIAYSSTRDHHIQTNSSNNFGKNRWKSTPALKSGHCSNARFTR
jgi:hypothetical protein